jgi:hypothetical protein
MVLQFQNRYKYNGYKRGSLKQDSQFFPDPLAAFGSPNTTQHGSAGVLW